MWSKLKARLILQQVVSADQSVLNLSLTKKSSSYSNLKKDDEDSVSNYEKLDIFHRAISPVLFVAQCLSLMPVMGSINADPRKVKFSFKSIQFVTTIVFCLIGTMFNLGLVKSVLPGGISAKNSAGMVFFSCGLFASILFLVLAKRWPAVIRYWTQTEMIFLKSPYESPQRKLSSEVRLAAVIIITLSAVEHGTYFMSSVYSYREHQIFCNSTKGPNFRHYMSQNYEYVFMIFPINMGIYIMILIVNFVFTFIWNYMDLFIMMVSTGIAYRFRQITVRVNKLLNKEIPEEEFSNIREHYVMLCDLLDYVDERMSSIILLSCINNLYFICFQLLNIFNKLRFPINYVYFWYSLLYLIGRTAFVFLSAASVNEESKASLPVLRQVSNKTWCSEVERLIYLMATQTVALTGMKFYSLTRRLLFGMAGTIVTYELVLLQLDADSRSKGLPDLKC